MASSEDKTTEKSSGALIFNCAMDYYNLLIFLKMLGMAINMPHTKGERIASIATATLFLCCVIFLSNTVSTKSSFTNSLVKESLLLVSTSPNSLEFANLLIRIKEDVRILVRVGYDIIRIYLPAVIIASYGNFCRDNLSVKDLLSRMARSWIRLFVTCFYITLLTIGYAFLVLAFLIPLRVLFGGPVVSYATSIVLVLVAVVFGTYLDNVFSYSIVVSVGGERCYGIDALIEARRLVKGEELVGFARNLLFTFIFIFAELVTLRLHKVE